MKVNKGRDEINDTRDVEKPTPVSSVPASPINSDSVGIRVIQPVQLKEPASMAPIVVEKPGKLVQPEATPLPQKGVRVSLGDGIVKGSGIAANSEPLGVQPSKPRAPQLVKTKATKISHTVVSAQSAQLEPAEPSVTEEMDRPVEVEVSMVPHAIAKASVEEKKAASEPKTGGAAQVAIKAAVPATFFEFDSNLANGVSTVVDGSSDDARRKFDPRTYNQSEAAVIELESLTATNIDLTGKLLGLAVQDESVCKVIQNDKMVTLVGNKVGTTMVQIWSAGLGNKPQLIRVNVSPKKGSVKAGRDDVKDIKQVISQNFPRAEVNLIGLSDGGIEVRGTTDSEDSAKRIMELVRKVYLVPVKDKLVVSR